MVVASLLLPTANLETKKTPPCSGTLCFLVSLLLDSLLALSLVEQAVRPLSHTVEPTSRSLTPLSLSPAWGFHEEEPTKLKAGTGQQV